VILTSVFTHLLEMEVRSFCREISRMLSERGRVYATFFTYKSKAEAVNPTEKRSLVFPFFKGNYALGSEVFPEAAVAFQEDFLIGLLRECGLEVVSTEYMFQNVFILKKSLQ
jgi:hypothetical protein